MGLALAYQPRTDHLAAPTETISVPPLPLKLLEFTPEVTVEIWEGAIEHARELADSHPRSATAFSRLAQAELALGLADDASHHAIQALELTGATGDAPAAIASAQILMALGKAEEAERLLRGTRINLEEAGLIYAELALARGDFRAALERLVERSDAASAALRGWVSLELRDFRSAIHWFRVATRVGQPAPDLLINLGYAYGAIGARKQALAATKEALYLAPGDRTAAFNLVSHFAAERDFDSALAELDRLQELYPHDLEVIAARADVKFQRGEGTEALKNLQQAMGRLTLTAGSATDRAELAANMAFLELRLGRRSKAKTIERLRGELLRADFRSLGIARMLGSLFTQRSDVSQMKTLIEGLRRHFGPRDLYQLEVDLRYLEGSYDEALRLALQWLENDPFDPDPAIISLFLLCDVRGDYESAAAIGLAAVRRIPGSKMLRNNTAFALALARRPAEAREVLPSDESSPYVEATRGLISFAEGDLDAGLSAYDRAIDMAKETGDERDQASLPYLIAVMRDLAMKEMGYQAEAALSPLLDADPEDPRIPLFNLMAKRILGVSKDA